MIITAKMLPYLSLIAVFAFANTQAESFRTGRSPCHVSFKKAVNGKYFDEVGNSLSFAPVSESTIIVDTNYIVASSRVAGNSAATHEVRYVAEYKALLERMRTAGKNAHISVTTHTAHEATGLSVKIPKATSLVKLEVSRDSDVYKKMIDFLGSKSVGGNKSNSMVDRRIVADALFSARVSKNDIPKFATGDFGIIDPLCGMHSECLKIMGNHKAIRERFPDGFSLSVIDDNGRARKLEIVPL